jgi:phage shock protein A
MLLGVDGIIWCATLNSKLVRQEQPLTDAAAQYTKLAAALRDTDARLNVAADELKTSLEERRSSWIRARTRYRSARFAASGRIAQLATAQQQTEGQVAEVSTAVTDVKTDVGGVKTDVAKTQSDLAETNNQMTSMKGI